MQSLISLSRKTLSSFLLALITLMLASQLAAGQATTATATLNGTVRDPSGAVLAGATIEVTNIQTGVRWKSESNSTGNYSLVGIAPGKYTAQVSKEGFSTEKQETVVLEVNQTATINFTLRVG
jgi:Carboxypeptidase regulatory-like domain